MPTFKICPAHQFFGEQSCGAYALTAALFQLNAKPPAQGITLHALDLASPAHGYIANPTATLTPTQSATNFAQSLYSITGNLEINFPPPGSTNGTAQYCAHTSKMFNAPSALVYAALQFGLQTVEIHATAAAQQIFSAIQGNAGTLWSSELQILHTLHVQPAIDQPPYAPPTDTNTVDLVLVDDGKHWVAVTWSGSKAEYYDPATGTEHDWPGTKTPTGIWIRLSK